MEITHDAILNCLPASSNQKQDLENSADVPCNLVPTLIELVKERVCLWRMDSPNYRDKAVKEEMYHQVANILQLDPGDVKKKWHSLRVYFVRDWKKIEGSLLTEEVYVPKFKWFKNMIFLKEAITSGPNTPSYIMTKLAENEEMEGYDPIEDSFDNDTSHMMESDQKDGSAPGSSGKSSSKPQSNIKKRLRKRKAPIKHDYDDFDFGFKSEPTPPPPPVAVCNHQQQHDSFGLSIAEQLRGFSASQVNVAKFKLQQVLFEVSTHHVAHVTQQLAPQLTQHAPQHPTQHVNINTTNAGYHQVSHSNLQETLNGFGLTVPSSSLQHHEPLNVVSVQLGET